MTNKQLGVVAWRKPHWGVSCVHGARGRRKLEAGKADLQGWLQVNQEKKTNPVSN